MLGRYRGGKGPRRDPVGQIGRALADPSGELAGYRREVEPGPSPLVRAGVGVLLGAACGAFTLVVLPRRADGDRPGLP